MSRYNPHHKNADAVFTAADEFKKRCLLDQCSLFLDDQRIWTGQHFQALIDNFVKRPDTSPRKFYEKLADQMATCQPPDVALMVEIFWIVQLAPTNLRADTKVSRLQRIWDMKLPCSFPIQSEFLQSDVLSGLGSAGPGYNQYLPDELIFAVDAFTDFVAKPLAEREALLKDAFGFARWLNGIPSGEGRQLYHTLCHVLFPDSFERIFSQGNKNQVARAHGIWTRAMFDRLTLDEALLQLRTTLEVQYPNQVDYYKPPVGTLVKAEAPSAPGVGVPSIISAPNGQTAPELKESESEYDADPIAQPTLRLADNLILFGPPGTGKTFEMQVRMKQAFDSGEDYAFVAFHPSYSYEDFIGGLRPVVAQSGGGVAVVFQKGPFLELCEKAHANPLQRFTLFIDEINRANVAKVFGELITLIEPTKRVVAGSKPNDNGAWVTLPGTQRLFGVPDNLNVVATMNTADRSIAMMDIALRRRFRFQECPPDPDQIEPGTVDGLDLKWLLRCLNDRLEFLLDRDHTIGHAVFMGVQTLDQLRAVLAQRVIPLLQEYFFEDLDKVRLALTGSVKGSAFFTSRALAPADLFPGGRGMVGSEARASFTVTAPNTWTEADMKSLYSPSPIQAPAPMPTPQGETGATA